MTGTVSFPITGGNVTYVDPESGVDPYVQGRVEHFQSGLTLTKGDTSVALMPGSEPNTAILEGTTVKLTKTAADALNRVFKTDALAEFLPVGIAEITVNVPAS